MWNVSEEADREENVSERIDIDLLLLLQEVMHVAVRQMNNSIL